MRSCVRKAFVTFSTPLEGCVSFLYADVKGLITTAIGVLVDPMEMALRLPFERRDGTRALSSEIAAEWLRVKQDPLAAKYGHLYAKTITNLRLTDEGIESVVALKLAQMDGYLTSRFADWEGWPADAQLATLSMAWACGPAFQFPLLDLALRARDFDGAVMHCKIQEEGNPGVAPRNLANRRLYANAARAQACHLDLDVLVWPDTLEDMVDTKPELPPNSTPRPRLVDSRITPIPTTAADQPTIHPDSSAYLRPSEWLKKNPEDPDDAA